MYPYPRGRRTRATCATTPIGDLVVRYRTMQGWAVLSPFGFDSFGLPAENAAIKAGIAPSALHRGANRRAQGSLIRTRRGLRLAPRGAQPRPGLHPLLPGRSSCAFLRAGLAYRAMAPVNWCPGCMTVLANEQVLADGTCERSRRPRRAPRPRAVVLPDHRLRRRAARRPRRPRVARAGQGRCSATGSAAPRASSSTSRVASDASRSIRVFTTRPDTGFGVTYAVVAPEHPLRRGPDHRRPARRASTELVERAPRPRARSSARWPAEGDARREARGVHRSRTSCNPFNGREVPVYVADYVLGRLRHGRHHGACRPRTSATSPSPPPTACRVVRTVEPPDGFDEGAYTGDGPKVNSGFLDGLDVADGHRGRPRSSSSAPAASRRSTTGCATGWSPASGSGAARSRSSTARVRDRRRCPTTSCPSSPPTT